MEKIERIKELVKLLNYYRDQYYNNSESQITDFEYDQLFDELSTLESQTGFVMATSPTQTVGYEVKSALEKTKHNHPMLSLDKTKSLDDIVNFIGDKEFVAMPKMDGLTCSVCYENGKLVSAETRGNGEIGESVLHNAKVIKNLPLNISYKNKLIVDGEVVISYDDFNAINDSLSDGEKYRNPRNLVSGSIRQLDSEVAAKRHMRFVAWKCITPINDNNNNSFRLRLQQLEGLGFETVCCFYERLVRLRTMPQYRSKKHTAPLADVVNWIQDWADEHAYPIDGCVFGYDDIAYGESLGATGHHLRSQIAYKFYDEVYETMLQYIDWTLGKTGVLTPTAVFDPVEIDGTEVNRASLHNISIIKSLGLTNYCTVRVFKANQIIPQIDSCDNDGAREIEIPSTCPMCGGKTAIKKDNESEVLMCLNPDCTGKKLARLEHFVSRNCMNIEGLSEATLERFISLGYISDFKSIYRLSEHKNKLSLLSGFGPKSVEKLLSSVEKSRDVKLENFIAALSIPNIGLGAAKTISRYFEGDYDKFVGAYFSSQMGNFSWTIIDDFGEVMAKSMHDYLEENLEMINELAKEMHFIKDEKKEVMSNPFIGKILCITGKLEYFSRDGINAKIVELGAKAASSVTSKTDYLITNEASGSSKYKKAVELNIPIITEEQFINMIKGE